MGESLVHLVKFFTWVKAEFENGVTKVILIALAKRRDSKYG